MTRAAYIVTLTHEGAETLILVPAETRSEAHRKAQAEIEKRQGWESPRIMESLRLPGQSREAAEQFGRIVQHHLQAKEEGNQP